MILMYQEENDFERIGLLERLIATGGALVTAKICVFLDSRSVANLITSSPRIDEIFWEEVPSQWRAAGRLNQQCFWTMHVTAGSASSAHLCAAGGRYLSPMLWSLCLETEPNEPLRYALSSPAVSRSLRRLEVDCGSVNIRRLLPVLSNCRLEQLKLDNVDDFAVVQPLLRTSLKEIKLSAARECYCTTTLEFPPGMTRLRELQLNSTRKGVCHVPARSLRNILEAARHLRWCSLAGATTDNDEDLICALFVLYSLNDLQLFDISFNPSRGWGMDPYRLYQLRRKLFPSFPIFCANEEASSICVCRGLGSAPVERLRESYLTCLWSRSGWTPERLACCEVGVDKLECRECEEILNWYSSSSVVPTVSHVVERAVCGRAPPPIVRSCTEVRQQALVAVRPQRARSGFWKSIASFFGR